MRRGSLSFARGALWLALLLAGARAATAPAAADPVRDSEGPFIRSRLEFPGTIQDHLLADADGDGRLDVLVIYGAPREPDDHRLAVCLQGADGRFLSCSEQDLADDVRALDVGTLGNAEGGELFLLTRQGVWKRSWRDGRFGPRALLAELPTVFAGTDAEVPRPLDLLFALDDEGPSALVLPTLEGPVVMRPGRPARQLHSPAAASYQLGSRGADINALLRNDLQSRITIQHLTPDLFVEDWDGDGRRDLLTVLDNRVEVFLQDSSGDFPEEPVSRVERSTLSDREAQSDFTGEATTVAQLDDDGRADLIVMKWGSSEERTQMDRAIFFSRPDGSHPLAPDQVVRSESVFPDFDVRDLNGDGRRDLVIPYFHFAPTQAVRVVTQNALRFQLRLFLMRPDGRYGQGEGKDFARVDRRVVLDYHLDILKLFFGNQARPTGRIGPLLDFAGDFNGDGFADLAADDGSDHLRIFFGDDKARYASSPDLVLPFESTLSYDLVDADGNGRSDLFAYHGTRPVREELHRGFHAVKRRRAQRERARRAEAQRAREVLAEEEPSERVRLEILMSR